MSACHSEMCFQKCALQKKPKASFALKAMNKFCICVLHYKYSFICGLEAHRCVFKLAFRSNIRK